MCCEMANNEIISNSEWWAIWIPACVSVLTLIINLIFYVFVQQKLALKSTSRESLKKASVELLSLLVELVSYEDFSGVPSSIRKLSINILLNFQKGKTPDGVLEKLLEDTFQNVQSRKKMEDSGAIDIWNKSFRELVHKVRMELSKYCGAL